MVATLARFMLCGGYLSSVLTTPYDDGHARAVKRWGARGYVRSYSRYHANIKRKKVAFYCGPLVRNRDTMAVQGNLITNRKEKEYNE
tara:strand:+ start:14451 stop:14711 length:261 start_codon:yes stop_codon:yes gene_type:complete